MDLELAKDVTYRLLKSSSKNQPEKNDFVFQIKSGGEIYNVIWIRDVNVINPEWHISFEKQ